MMRGGAVALELPRRVTSSRRRVRVIRRALLLADASASRGSAVGSPAPPPAATSVARISLLRPRRISPILTHRAAQVSPTRLHGSVVLGWGSGGVRVGCRSGRGFVEVDRSRLARRGLGHIARTQRSGNLAQQQQRYDAVARVCGGGQRGACIALYFFGDAIRGVGPRLRLFILMFILFIDSSGVGSPDERRVEPSSTKSGSRIRQCVNNAHKQSSSWGVPPHPRPIMSALSCRAPGPGPCPKAFAMSRCSF